MKFWEAIKALEEGKKVRKIGWVKNDYVHLSKGLLIDEDGQYFEFDHKDFVGSWEIYEEAVITYTFMEAIKDLEDIEKE